MQYTIAAGEKFPGKARFAPLLTRDEQTRVESLRTEKKWTKLKVYDHGYVTDLYDPETGCGIDVTSGFLSLEDRTYLTIKGRQLGGHFKVWDLSSSQMLQL